MSKSSGALPNTFVVCDDSNYYYYFQFWSHRATQPESWASSGPNWPRFSFWVGCGSCCCFCCCRALCLAQHSPAKVSRLNRAATWIVRFNVGVRSSKWMWEWESESLCRPEDDENENEKRKQKWRPASQRIVMMNIKGGQPTPMIERSKPKPNLNPKPKSISWWVSERQKGRNVMVWLCWAV